MSSSKSKTSRRSLSSSSHNKHEKETLVKDNARLMANIDDLETYMEKLYDEDMESKLDGLTQILYLSEYAANIEALIQNEALMVNSNVFLVVFDME